MHCMLLAEAHLPVCPYAKMHTLRPSSTLTISGCRHLNTSPSLALAPSTCARNVTARQCSFARSRRQGYPYLVELEHALPPPHAHLLPQLSSAPRLQRKLPARALTVATEPAAAVAAG